METTANVDVEITACSASEDHLQRLIALGSTYYPAGHPALTKAFLKWFYLDNPAGTATLIIARQADTWIGLIVLIPVALEWAGRPQKACYAVNVLTHPEHRGKRLFVKMISHARSLLAEQGVWLLGHPNAEARPGWTKQQMQFRDSLQLHFAKFRLPFSSLRESRIDSLSQLEAIPSSFWIGLADRPDVHLKYDPAFIAWRYLDAPHRQYAVSAVERRGDFLGLRVTRRFKAGFDLMVDFIGVTGALRDLVSGVRRPTMVMHPGQGSAAAGVIRGCWKSPIKREFAFFVSTWDERHGADMTGITLAASDF